MHRKKHANQNKVNELLAGHADKPASTNANKVTNQAYLAPDVVTTDHDMTT